MLRVPDHMLTTKTNLIKDVFGDSIDIDDPHIEHKVILSPKNVDVSEWNNTILSLVSGKESDYLSVDTADDDDSEPLDEILPTEFLNSLNPNGLPPHRLVLKIGAIVILLRNLNIENGLCNGTRLRITNLMSHCIGAEIISGQKMGRIVLIPRINLSPSKEEIPFNMSRI